ncbi:zinc ribbon domain-containing protein [Waterburya agarophytonicola K14]|uniref:Zinc ribbon domain-containing protein n=1 Tax=Waterburya agarophytonicola KI4 TaxID=2874699 RepID=A0A964FGE2_9CYAN|nr:zinc ribbon domain-containing protein [Waterburya agarophytonicola]MCC0178765.1 zinc ribbon domain-containing protein [Waterburya agarophytonicola KI4]
MLSCPKCKQPVDFQAIKCPNCNNSLKAFGHPGMPLYQSEDNSALCDRCTYDRDDSCNFPQRPQAKSCTLFHDADKPLVVESTISKSTQGWTGIKNWLYRHRGLIAIAFLILISILFALGSI